MTTTITISAYSINVSIAGVSVRIDRDELFEGLKTIKTFYDNVVPEERKASMIGSGIEDFFANIDKYKPFAESFLSCWTFEGTAKSTFTINEDGTIDMHSSEQTARFEFKKYIQLLSDLSTFMENEGEAKEEAEHTIIKFQRGKSYQDLFDTLSDSPIWNTDVMEYINRATLDCEVTTKAIEYINILLESNNASVHFIAPDSIDIQEGIQRVDFHRILKANDLINEYPKSPEGESLTGSLGRQWLSQRMTAQMIENFVDENYLHGLIKVIPAEPSITDEPIGKINLNGTPVVATGINEEETE